jgi:ABC-type transport system involved in cytochrome bd biosynthesis fused ATPase/permease subunit
MAGGNFMNIRMDSKEVRFRINQDEVNTLLETGFIQEGIWLPKHQFFFNVKLHNHIGLHHKENQITFCIDQSMREKLINPDNGLVAEVLDENCENPVCFKLEVDLFNSKQRNKRP